MNSTDLPKVNPFTLVLIPSDETKPVVEERFNGHSEEELRKYMTRYFRQALLSEDQKKDMARHLMEKTSEQAKRNATPGTDAPETTPAQQQEIIDGYLDQCSYEIIPVTMPMRATGFIGTSLYVDDSGVFKDLSVNYRASTVAQRSIRGDAFMLSNHDDPALDEWGRVDCTLATYEKLHANPPSSYDTSNQAQMNKAAMLREAETKLISPEDAEAALKSKDDGNAFFAKGDHKAAIQAYSHAIELTVGRSDLLPNEADVTALRLSSLLNRSLCHARINAFGDAAKDAQSAVDLDPTSVKAYYRLTQALIGKQEFEDARRALDMFTANGGTSTDAQPLSTAITEGSQRVKEQRKKIFSKMFN